MSRPFLSVERLWWVGHEKQTLTLQITLHCHSRETDQLFKSPKFQHCFKQLFTVYAIIGCLTEFLQTVFSFEAKLFQLLYTILRTKYYFLWKKKVRQLQNLEEFKSDFKHEFENLKSLKSVFAYFYEPIYFRHYY